MIVCDCDIPCSSLIYPSSAVMRARKNRCGVKVSAGKLERVLGAVYGRRKAGEGKVGIVGGEGDYGRC